ncbi:RhoGAP-domain-containing protein [Meredithblackwellia eburnea MCA 4105]
MQSQQALGTYGLATQLRTPPQQQSPSFSSSTTVPSSSSIPRKVTPAMRAEQRRRGGSPTSHQFATPTWSSNVDDNGVRSEKREREGKSRKTMTPGSSSTRRREHGSSSSSSRHERSKSQGPPARPARPESPSLFTLPSPTPQHAHKSLTQGPGRSPQFDNKQLDSSFLQTNRTLDLGIKLDSNNIAAPFYSTYSASKSSPNLSSIGSPSPSGGGGNLNQPRPRPPQARPDADGTARAIGQGARQSYAGSTTAPTTTLRRRSSSLYIPNPSPSSSSSSATSPKPTSSSQGLVTLAQRTAHLASTPGYGWRLHLLEKLETVTGAFLGIQEAQVILTIGNGAADSLKNTKLQSRKSQIGLPPPSPVRAKVIPPKSPAAADPKGGFFRSMKRAFTASSPSESTPTSPTSPKFPPAKVMFGVPLSQSAQYGFVTSMIAGQRHDLPSVAFATVEEIYRRGQGNKIPGLLHLAGEPTRIARLVEIYNSPPDYGERHELSVESIHNVTSLLKKYLRELPEPILDGRLWRLFNVACLESSNSLKRRVAAAQLILRLLPAPNFSLMVYLVAFLSQVPLFPENRLTLENVSLIFGPPCMSPRQSSSSVSKVQKFVISNPTESAFDGAASVKKGQDGLLWLLKNWNAVADGLLEPEFELDMNQVMDRPSAKVPVMSRPPVPKIPSGFNVAASAVEGKEENVNMLAPPKSVMDKARLQSPSPVPTLEIHNSPSAPSQSTPYHEQSARGASPVNGLRNRPNSPATTLTPRTLHAASGSSSAGHGSPSSFISTPTTASPHLPQTQVRAGQRADDEEQSPALPAKEFPVRKSSITTTATSHSTNTSNTANSDSSLTPEMPALAVSNSSRSSDSTLSTSSGNGAGKGLHIHHAVDKKGLGLQGGFRREAPEDEFGPLGPAGTSVLDDLLTTEENSSLFNFPNPPKVNLAGQRVSTGSIGSPAHLNLSPGPETFVRPAEEQLRESQQVQESQRREIQTLWKQLTDNELARASERADLVKAREELAEVRKARGGVGMMETRRTIDGLREELRQLREEKERSEQRAREDIANLTRQLEAIRSVLGSRL